MSYVPPVLSLLAPYNQAEKCQYLPPDNIDDIFVTKDKNGWHRRSNLDKWTAEFSKMLDVDFYYHCMRHYTCTAFAKKNIPIDVIKEFFGWSSTELVGIYNDSSAEDDFGKYFTKDGIKEGKQGSLSDL